MNQDYMPGIDGRLRTSSRRSIRENMRQRKRTRRRLQSLRLATNPSTIPLFNLKMFKCFLFLN